MENEPKEAYVLTDGGGIIHDARFMTLFDFVDEQRKAREATDGEFSWILAELYYRSLFGKVAGSATSDAKRKTSAENGKKGGRPATRHYRRGEDVSKQAKKAYWSDEIPF